MISPRLRFTGPEGRPYVLGEPIEVFDGAALIGRVRTVTPSPDGTELFIENFLTVDLADFRSRALPKLVLAEVVAFITAAFPSIHAITIELSRDLRGYEGREVFLASARADTLQSIGTRDIQVTPKPTTGRPGHFAVRGVWHYDGVGVAALADTLQAERAAYQGSRVPPPIPVAQSRKSSILHGLRRVWRKAP